MTEIDRALLAKNKGAAPCGLYIKVGPHLAMDVLTKDMKQIFHVLNSSKYERNMHALEVRGDINEEGFHDKATALFAAAHYNGVASIWRGTAAQAKELGADGVLLDNPDDVPVAREILGEKAIIGLFCGLSQEKACAAHDAHADFVSFGTGKDTMPAADPIKFWAILSDKPSVAEGPITNDYCDYFVKAGATFIDAGDFIWSHPQGVMQGAVDMLYAIELALEEKTQKKPQ